MSIVSQTFRDPGLGIIHLVVNRRSVRCTLRTVDNGAYRLTVPAGMDRPRLEEVLAHFRLLRRTKSVSTPGQAHYTPGWTCRTPWHEIVIEKGTRPGHMYCGLSRDGSQFIIQLAPDVDPAAGPVRLQVHAMLDHYSRNAALVNLLPFARQVCRELGLPVRDFDIGRGRRRLGCCYGDGRITLSRYLVFYPLEVQRHVICHELAHLSHMDHSPAFHDLCNRYDGGREKELVALMKKHRLPYL